MVHSLQLGAPVFCTSPHMHTDNTPSPSNTFSSDHEKSRHVAFNIPCFVSFVHLFLCLSHVRVTLQFFPGNNVKFKLIKIPYNNQVCYIVVLETGVIPTSSVFNHPQCWMPIRKKKNYVRINRLRIVVLLEFTN